MSVPDVHQQPSVFRPRRRKGKQEERKTPPDPLEVPKKEDAISLQRRCLAKLTSDPDYSMSQFNTVSLSPELFSKLVPVGEQDQCTVRVSNLILRAIKDPSLEDIRLDVNHVIYNQLLKGRQYEQDFEKIWVHRVDPSQVPVSRISYARFRVFPCGTLNVFGKSDRAAALLVSSLERQLRQHYNGEIFKKEQEIFIRHPSLGPLRLVLENWEYEDIEVASFSGDQFLPYYGRLIDQTKVSFVTGNSRELKLVEQYDSTRLERFYFSIVKVTNVSERIFSSSQREASKEGWKNGVQPLPLPMPFSEICELITEAFSGKAVPIGHQETFIAGGWQFHALLKQVKVSTQGAGVDDEEMDPDTEVEKIFCLDDDHGITVASGSQVLLTTDWDNARTATEMMLEIIDIERDDDLLENEVPWVSVLQVAEAVKAEKLLLTKGCKTVIEIDDVQYLLKLSKTPTGEPAKFPLQSKKLSDVWVTDEKTKINVCVKKGVELFVVDTPKAFELESLTVKVSSPGGGPNPLAAFFGEEDDAETTIIGEEELKKIFFESISENGIVLDKQTPQGTTAKGKTIDFKLDKLKPKERVENSYYGEVFRCTENTKIVFEGEKSSDITIQTKAPKIGYDDISSRLIELGIGGMPQELKDFITRYILSLGMYSEYVKKLDQMPTRGILLHGAPGTGKTLIARKIGELLNISKERIKLVKASDVWNKYVGESEKSIVKVFKEARDEQNRLGDKSEKFLFIFDEFEAIGRKREGDSKTWEVGVVTTILSQIDGPDPLNNCLIICMTNHMDQLDSAILRPGRIFPHFHIGIPNLEGRQEIVEIHTRKIKEAGFLADDFSTGRVAEMTVGKTGAFIRGMVIEAGGGALLRLKEQKVEPDRVDGHPAAKLTMADFERAFQACLDSKVKKSVDAPFIPAKEPHKKMIQEDLRRLGLGGFNDEVITFLHELRVSQLYKDYLFSIDHTFPRGVLLYGQPGSGKTSLAKGIKKLFALDDQQFQYLKASELWPLQGPFLKAKIEEILKPAKDASQDLREEAGLHVVVVDELDLMFLQKQETDTPDASVMNRFLMELEPLFEQDDGGQIHNLLVIGIAHRNFLGIPGGIVRHGRLGKHVEIKAPSLEGRKAIFKIHLRGVIEKGALGKKVEIQKLAEMTKGYTGAYIEGLVSQAGINAMRRAATQEVLPETLRDERVVTVRMKDFEEAHRSMRIDPKWQGYII